MATSVWKPESKDLAQSSIDRMSCVSQEKPGLKPCCLGVRILLESNNKYLLFELVNKYIPATKSYDNGRMKKPIWMSHKALKAVKKK